MQREEKRVLLARFKKTTDLPLPQSGIVAEVRRPPLAAWITAGEVPDSLFAAATKALADKDAAAASISLPDVFAFALKIARATFVFPRLTEEGQSAADDEDMIDPATLPLGDLQAIMRWAMTGSPGVPVETSSGEVGAEALANFRPDEAVPRGGDDGGPSDRPAV